ncbi:putative MFS family arabinose efflux permease [Mesorhizobium sp. J18]|uniref:MFS transporter n=1 Tax=Mesorhizobium sp. J18 TaxID=935263 RepID=UPI00119C53B9|nr:MFS transporter [Mesorhizobium sp. J18]TWG98269.1 putative MFS family arabinose efflux permease [Mesorhizobium sp. J18]
MILRRTVLCLGLAQLISWGISYYLIGGFGEQITTDLGWSRDRVYGGFSVALLVMGLTSPVAGRLIDRYGGRRVMIVGSLLNAAGCIGIAASHDVVAYYMAWVCLGLAMRLTLYDAAFAALARIGGPEARWPIAQITLLGGLASTVFWPLGHLLAEYFGWRGALLAYAGFALLTLPLHLAIPEGRYREAPAPEDRLLRPAPIVERRNLAVAGGLYALIMALANFLNAGMSAHMIGILAGLGLAASTSVWVATLRGVGQSSARLCEVLFGRKLDPLMLNLIASLFLPLSFVAGLFSGYLGAAAIAFAFLYGVGNGLLTITRGTLPLVLFDHRTYGAFVGRLIAPSFVLSAASPIIYAFAINRFGQAGALYLSIGVSVVILAAAALLLALAVSWRNGGE